MPRVALVKQPDPKRRLDTSSDPLALLSPQETADLLGVHVRTLERMVSSGEFPAPLALNEQTLRFRRAWLADYQQRLEAEAEDARRRRAGKVGSK